MLVLLSQQPFIFSPPQVRVGVSTQTATPLLPAPNKGTAPQLPQSALDALNKFKEAGEKMAIEDEAGYSSSPEVVALSSDDEDKDETACAVDLTVSPEETGKGEQKSLAVSAEELGPGVRRYLAISYVHCLTLKAKLPVCMYTHSPPLPSSHPPPLLPHSSRRWNTWLHQQDHGPVTLALLTTRRETPSAVRVALPNQET